MATSGLCRCCGEKCWWGRDCGSNCRRNHSRRHSPGGRNSSTNPGANGASGPANRPWYTTKTDPSTTDMLYALRDTLTTHRINTTTPGHATPEQNRTSRSASSGSPHNSESRDAPDNSKFTLFPYLPRSAMPARCRGRLLASSERTPAVPGGALSFRIGSWRGVAQFWVRMCSIRSVSGRSADAGCAVLERQPAAPVTGWVTGAGLDQ